MYRVKDVLDSERLIDSCLIDTAKDQRQTRPFITHRAAHHPAGLPFPSRPSSAPSIQLLNPSQHHSKTSPGDRAWMSRGGCFRKVVARMRNLGRPRNVPGNADGNVCLFPWVAWLIPGPAFQCPMHLMSEESRGRSQRRVLYAALRGAVQHGVCALYAFALQSAVAGRHRA